MSDFTGVWECPAGTLVLPADAPREVWLAERRKGIGGSDLAALFGEAKYGNTEYAVWADKTGRSDELVQNEAMEWGVRFEDAVAEKFGDETGLGSIKAGLMRSKQVPQLLASVDRLTDDGQGLECKFQGWFMAKEYGNDQLPLIPRQFYWQMVEYMAVTGRKGWWLAALCGQKFFIRHLSREQCQADIDRVLELVPAWWQQYVYEDNVPENGKPGEELETSKDLKIEASIPGMVVADVARWRELREVAKAAKEELDEIKARMKQELGRAEVLTVRGIPMVKMQHRRGSSKFDRARLKREQPTIEAEYSTTGPPSNFPVLIGDTDDDN
jgi:putative phage-type endonuclease